MANEIREIVVHCSDSKFGNAAMIRQWHQEKKWRDIGYHFVILNGLIQPGFMLPSADGSIEVGRALDGDSFLSDNEVGAHAYGYNKHSLGICLIGVSYFTLNQLASLAGLLGDLCIRFGLDTASIYGHYELSKGKTCPNINMDQFRASLDPIGLYIGK